MPQNNPFGDLKNPNTNGLVNGSLDAEGVSQLLAQGLKSALNLTAATVVKTGAGRLVKISVISGGTTGGAFAFNDCATTGAATAANQIFTLPFGATAGSVYVLDVPVVNGLVLSAVPTAGAPQLAISYT
jgi:hypothetical protein